MLTKPLKMRRRESVKSGGKEKSSTIAGAWW